MNKVWFLVFVVFVISLIAFFKQEKIKDTIGIEDPDSKIGKKIDEGLGLERVHQVDRAKRVGTKAEFNSIKTAFVMYYATYGEYPKSIEELVSKGMIDRAALSDFWQQGYRTEIDGTDMILTSPGPDRIKNTQDDETTRISLVGGSGEQDWERATQ